MECPKYFEELELPIYKEVTEETKNQSTRMLAEAKQKALAKLQEDYDKRLAELHQTFNNRIDFAKKHINARREKELADLLNNNDDSIRKPETIMGAGYPMATQHQMPAPAPYYVPSSIPMNTQYVKPQTIYSQPFNFQQRTNLPPPLFSASFQQRPPVMSLGLAGLSRTVPQQAQRI